MAIGDNFDKLAERLRKERDELRVQIHLGSLELQDEWRELESKWARLEQRLGHKKGDVVEAARDLGAGIEVVADELTQAYRRIRKRLAD